MTAPVLITGVAKRIGLALARHFLNQGIPVIGTYRSDYDSLEQLKALGAELYACDLSKDAEVASFIDQVRSSHPALRALIHNASDWLPDNGTGASSTDDAATFARMMHIHASIPYQLNRAFTEQLSAAKHADIIHFTDYVADKGSKKHMAYAASKAALENLSKSFAQQLAPDIKVNAIAPALILFNDDDSQVYREKAVQKALIPREGGLQEVIAAVDYLFNSRYVTGRTLHLDGGRHLK